MTYLVNIIGAGNVGRTIGYLLVKNGIAKIGAVQSTSEENARRSIDFIGEGKFYQDLNNLPQADISFITTPDDHIAETCLTYCDYFKPGSIIIHCSGSLTSDVLSSAKKKECSIVSVHPMRSFAKPDMSILQHGGTFCAIEGDANILIVISSLFESIGFITYTINKDKKSFYHTTGVFASNYLVTLSKQASLCMKEAGVDGKMAMKIVTSLMKGTVNNLEQTLSPEQSLTGPIQRGDISTIKNHMVALANNSEQSELYSVLGKATLKVANHSEHKRRAIEKALSHRAQCTKDMNKIKRGIYEHYKKKYYEVIEVARHSETLEDMVFYRMLADDFSLWVRPLTMFLEDVEIEGKKIPRFKFVSSETAKDFLNKNSF